MIVGKGGMIGMPFELDRLRMRAPDEFDQRQGENPLAEPFMPRDFETPPLEMGIHSISQDFPTPRICRLHVVDKDPSVEQACRRDVLRGKGGDEPEAARAEAVSRLSRPPT